MNGKVLFLFFCLLPNWQNYQFELLNDEEFKSNIETNEFTSIVSRSNIELISFYEDIDTILVNLDSINRLDSIENLEYINYDNSKTIDFLRINSYKQNTSVCFLTDSLRLTYELWKELNEIPLPIYQKIFPNSDEFLVIKKKYISRGSQVIKGDDLVKIPYGKKLTIKKKYSKIYSFNETKNYIQLILLSEGKYFPKAHLVNLSKSQLKFLDDIIIFDSFVDAGNIDIAIGCLDYETNDFIIWDIHNSTTKSNGELADTIQINYNINSNGEFNKKSEKLLAK